MTKHTQTIRRQQPTNYLSVFGHFVGLAIEGLMVNLGLLFSTLLVNHANLLSQEVIYSI